MNDVIKGLFERKSVRVYSDEMIEEDKKKLIIDAAIPRCWRLNSSINN